MKGTKTFWKKGRGKWGACPSVGHMEGGGNVSDWGKSGAPRTFAPVLGDRYIQLPGPVGIRQGGVTRKSLSTWIKDGTLSFWSVHVRLGRDRKGRSANAERDLTTSQAIAFEAEMPADGRG